MAAIFGERKILLPRVHCLDTLWVENVNEIALSRKVKEIEANLCFSIFSKSSKIQNGCHFWGEENFLKIAIVHFLDTLWVNNFDEIALSSTVKEIEANFVFPFLVKIRKFKMAGIFGERKISLKIANSTFLRYPEG